MLRRIPRPRSRRTGNGFVRRRHSLASREVTALFPLVNRRDDSPRNRFSVTSEDVRDAEKAAREKGIDVVGWYHSHPDHPAKPSQFDQDHAWPWYSYIIVSVANGRPETMTSWRLTDDRYPIHPGEFRNRRQRRRGSIRFVRARVKLARNTETLT